MWPGRNGGRTAAETAGIPVDADATPGKPIIGLCGGIGAGKSHVAAILAELGCCVIDSDRLSHAILARPEVLAELERWWGPGVRRPDGTPDRRRIGEIVFADGAEKQRLESLLYPLIAKERGAIIAHEQTNSAVKAIVIDSPLLFESNLDRLCDVVIYVDAEASRRRERLRVSRGWTDAEVERRERWQLSADEKRRRADFVVDNNGSPGAVRPQVADILERIVRGTQRRA